MPFVKDVEKAIIKTLAYADVFDYPLRFDELFLLLISEKRISQETIRENLSRLSGVVCEKGLCCFSSRTAIVKTRMQREKESQKKIKFIKRMIPVLALFPSVLFAGISGGLAMGNAKQDDDIDLFIITQKNKLWISRILLIVLLSVLGIRRKRNDRTVKDKVCLNMFIDEARLMLPLKTRDLYTAHEAVQMLPLFDRSNTYKKFLEANSWIQEFLPNALQRKTSQTNMNYKESFFNSVLGLFLHFALFEFLAKIFQLWNIKRHTTRETVTKYLLAFHPLDYRTMILDEYKKRLKAYERI